MDLRYRATVSALIITYNEENKIEDCFKGLQWVDEIIVVDAFSSDRTVEVVKEYTPRVYQRSWPGFGPQKNFGIEQVSSEWILIVDADERVTPELRKEIQYLMERWSPEGPVAYQIPRRNFYYGRWIRWGGTYPDYQIRLFRKGTARYNDVEVHENLLVNGKIDTLHSHLDHYTERQIEDHFRKFDLYTTLAAQEMGKSRCVVHWYDLLFRPLVILAKAYIFKQGFRDGIHGIIISVFASMYTFVKYAKLWEILHDSYTTNSRSNKR